MKKQKLILTNEKRQHFDLLQDIAQTKCALDSAYCHFENALEPELIDSYIYEVNAVQKRYNFLLERARKLDVDKSQMLS